MHVISRKHLREFWTLHPDVKEPLEVWYYEAEHAAWDSFETIQAAYSGARSIGKNRVIFNIKGNHYRLIVRINYMSGTVFIRFVGTHAEYDRIIDATEI